MIINVSRRPLSVINDLIKASRCRYRRVNLITRLINARWLVDETSY